MTDTAAQKARWEAVMMRNYGTPSVALARGEGSRVWDVDGRSYLDLVAGIAVSSLGHAHPAVVEAAERLGVRLGSPGGRGRRPRLTVVR